MPGYTGKILRVDLRTGDVAVETPPDLFYRRYLGGRGLAAYYLLREVPPAVQPFDPENLFILAPGVLAGSPLAGTSRTSAASISPLTGGFSSAEGGGYWGAELKRAGWDALIVTGRASHPTWIHIRDDQVRLRDASKLTGRTTADVEEIIRTELRAEGDAARVRVAQCGPAAERGVRYANVAFDLTHFAGRGGHGAVMAAKNLRAVAVHGSTAPEMAQPDQVKELSRWMATAGAESSKSFTANGTPGIVTALDAQGGLPTRNFRQGHFEGAAEIGSERLNATLLTGNDTCYACPIRCKRVVEAETPWKIDPVYGGPEYETIGALGSVCGVSDLAAICKGNELCAAYGLDTISAGVCVAYAMECFEEGILGPADTGGLDLRFGDAEAMVALVEQIAHRRGLGDLLAEGVARAAQRLADRPDRSGRTGRAAELAMHVKGQEIPMHEPRLKAGLGLGYEVSPTGADHCHNIHDTIYAKSVEGLKPFGILDPLPAASLEPAKVRLFYYRVNWQHYHDSALMCNFVPWSLLQEVEVLRAVTGWNTSLWEMAKAGERAATLARLVNLRRGLGAATERLPGRFHEAFAGGPLDGAAVDPRALAEARRVYYQMAGWDEHGVPTESKLAELDISWAAGA